MNPAIGIVSALEKEYVAVRSVFDRCEEHTIPGVGAGRHYFWGEIDHPASGPHKIVSTLADKGLNSAANRASLMLERFPSIHCVLMVGIACGVPNPAKAETHVRLGDIVVSDKKGVLQYDLRKRQNGVDVVREQWFPPDAETFEASRLLAADALAGKRPWEAYLRASLKSLRWKRPAAKTDLLADTHSPGTWVTHPPDPNRRRGQPRVFSGPIGTANTLLKDAKFRDQLRDQ